MDPKLREALKYLKQAQAARDSGDYAEARDLCNKSTAAFSTPEASKLLESINALDPQYKVSQTQPIEAEPSNRNQARLNEPHETSFVDKDDASTALRDDESESSDEEEEVTAISLEQRNAVARVLLCDENAYYDILCVMEDATVAEIKTAYRKLALQLDPNHNKVPGASAAFSLVSTSYQILGDKAKRAEYDDSNRDKASEGVSLVNLEETAPDDLPQEVSFSFWETIGVLKIDMHSKEDMLEYTQWFYRVLAMLGYPNIHVGTRIISAILDEIDGTKLSNEVRQQLLALMQWPLEIYEAVALKLRMSGMSQVVGTDDFNELAKADICGVLIPAIVPILHEVISLATWLDDVWIAEGGANQSQDSVDDYVAAKDHIGILINDTFIQVKGLLIKGMFDEITDAWDIRKSGKDVLDFFLRDIQDDTYQRSRENVKNAFTQEAEAFFENLRENVRARNQNIEAEMVAEQIVARANAFQEQLVADAMAEQEIAAQVIMAANAMQEQILTNAVQDYEDALAATQQALSRTNDSSYDDYHY